MDLYILKHKGYPHGKTKKEKKKDIDINLNMSF